MESGLMLEHHLAAAPATYSLYTVGTGAGPGFTSANARPSDGWVRSVWEQDVSTWRRTRSSIRCARSP